MNAKYDAIIQLHQNDNVAIALKELAPKAQLTEELLAQDGVPSGHKLALTDIAEGSKVLKFGQCIGVAKTAIKAGEHVHTHNLTMPDTNGNKQAETGHQPTPKSKGDMPTFMGYHRDTGRIGTRNYIGILASVNCSASVVAAIARQFEGQLNDYPNVDGVLPLTHGSGCGIPSEGAGMTLLKRTLSGYLNHPNFYGFLVVGLGCEVNQADKLLDFAERSEDSRFAFLNTQDCGGTSEVVKQGVSHIQRLLEEANQCHREKLPVSNLTLSLQCGGSDAWSGISANPALGAASDLLVSYGGTSILAETPEIYGAEQLLTARADNEQVTEDLYNKIEWWDKYLDRHDAELNNNPSPGNLRGGLSTILEKSLGAVAKGGNATLKGVADYAQAILDVAPKGGLVFMDSPGYDPCSVTGQVAAGATVVAFTTGRGSTFGAAGAPTIKLASNSELYQRMSGDMDVNCGAIIDGAESVESMGQLIFEQIIRIASGEPTKSEELGFGMYEFVPWVEDANV